MEILLPRVKYTHEIVGTHGGALPSELAPGACSGSKIPRVYRPLLACVVEFERRWERMGRERQGLRTEGKGLPLP